MARCLIVNVKNVIPKSIVETELLKPRTIAVTGPRHSKENHSKLLMSDWQYRQAAVFFVDLLAPFVDVW
ncbi:hypothetical protein J6590_040717 [Homalodisca vitripennis]|nr:hypothetical protein J6590_040717 [Homalodisca vitripennis]